MKTMTCKQLGGACDVKFQAETFRQMAGMSQRHGTEMFQKGDEAHIEVMREMTALMNDQKAMNAWMNGKEKEFDALPEDK